MSMIGLLTGAPQATGSKARADDTGASGFGTALQGELAALADAGVSDSSTEPVLSLAPTVETTAANGLPGTAMAALPASAAPLGELGDALGTSLPASTLPSAVDLAPTTPVSLGELVETPAGSSLPASTPTPPVALVEPAPTAPATPVEFAPAGTPAPLAPTVETPAASSSPAAMPTPASPVELVENPAGNSPAGTPAAPVEPAKTPTGSPSQGQAPAATVPAAPPTPLTAAVPTPEGNSAHAAAPRTDSAAASGASGRVGAATETGSATASSSSSAAAQPSTSTTAATPAAPVAAPVQASAPVASAPVASVAAPAPTAPVPFTTQLARPIFSLAAAGAGEHTMTVSVTPDNLGPVTVRAHVGAEGVRVELFAPNDLGREAIRAIIPDLRRDLAGAGLGSNLSLSSQNQPAADGSSHGSGTGQPGERATERGNSGDRSVAGENPDAAEQAVDRTGRFGTTSTIDVLA